MMWKDTQKVAFGRRQEWLSDADLAVAALTAKDEVVMWYCDESVDDSTMDTQSKVAK